MYHNKISLFLLVFCIYIVSAIPNPFQTPITTLEKYYEDTLYAELEPLLNDEDDIERSCDACISIIKTMKRFCYFPERLHLAIMSNVCKRTKLVDDQVCEGMVREQGPVLRKVMRTLDVSGRDGHLVCAAALNSCPYPDVIPWDVEFPKPKPKPISKPEKQGEIITVLHLSDWHLDPQYEEGADTVCSKPICCRSESTDYNNITNKASPWGSFGCDTPLSLVESMLEYIPTIENNISFALFTGDVPPHEVWETLPIEKTQAIQDSSYALLHAHFDTPFLINTHLYPVIGNHESAPTNLFPLKDSNLPKNNHDYLNMDWLYKSLEDNWDGWVSPHHLPSVHLNSGSYTAHPVKGLKLISLNTNFCYHLNWWLYQQPTERDPNDILKWLIDQLQQSEDKGEKVWIEGHTPPGDHSCLHDYSNYYYQIVERYAPHVIVGQFFGHSHRDEYQLFYKNGSQKAKDAISVAYIGPSITPFPDLNPGFRVYKVDGSTFEVVESSTYIAYLEDAMDWDMPLYWQHEYSASTHYDINSKHKPLSPGWWHKLSEKMELNDTLFNSYWQHRYKSSILTPECNEVCRYNSICGIRAGRSQNRCDYIHNSDNNKPSLLFKEKDACGLGSVLKK